MQAATSTDASLSPAVTTYASTVPVKAEATTASTEAPASEGGLPQLKTEHWGGQIVWLLIIFAVFYTLMATVFTPRIRKVISPRGPRIA
jgi:F-type H+-transporting ATPase subunit b